MAISLTPVEYVRLRDLCKRTIVRLPSVLEFNEYNRRFDALETDEELSDFAVLLARLVDAYEASGVEVLHAEPFPYWHT